MNFGSVCVNGSFIAVGSQPSPHIIPDVVSELADLSILTILASVRLKFESDMFNVSIPKVIKR